MIDAKIILTDLKKRLEEFYSDSLGNVILFGSRASDTAHEFSDFDVLVLMNKDYSRGDENRILDICYEVDLKYGILIDIHLLTMKELETIRGKQPIYVNAFSKGLYI